MKKPNRSQHFEVGHIVKSVYRSRWIGIIVGVKEWAVYKGRHYPIYEVLPIYDRSGNRQPKHIKSRSLAQDWLVTHQ